MIAASHPDLLSSSPWRPRVACFFLNCNEIKIYKNTQTPQAERII